MGGRKKVGKSDLRLIFGKFTNTHLPQYGHSLLIPNPTLTRSHRIISYFPHSHPSLPTVGGWDEPECRQNKAKKETTTIGRLNALANDEDLVQ